MVKVNENLTDGMSWMEVRNIIIKLDSDVYHQTNIMHANAAQSKSCRACGKSGHMSASCNIAKTKLNCTYCDLKGSHNTNACLKKKKANKSKESSKERDNKKKNESKNNPPPPREPSNTTKRTNSTSFRRNRPSSQESFHNVCVQFRLKEEMDSGDSDSDDESYTTTPESNQYKIITIEEVDPMDANTAELTEDE